MTKKKLIITITSLCLVVVAAVAAVVGILAAQQVNITSSLKVTYTPTPQVIATVSARYSVKGDASPSAINNTVITEYTTTTSDYTLDLTNVTLDDTKTYVVFEFKFQNNAVEDNTNSKTLHVAVAGTPTVKNMTPTIRYSTEEVALTDEAVKGISASNTEATVLKNIGIGGTGYMYVLIERVEGKAGSWNAANYAFTLTATENAQ